MIRILFFVVVVVSALGFAARGQDPKPNIVVIVGDDQGWGDVGAFGAAGVQTTNLDRLCNSGARLANQRACPVCTPSRASLMTGRQPTRNGLYTALRAGDQTGLPEFEDTLAEKLRGAGYATRAVGKWHLGHWPLAALQADGSWRAISPFRPMNRGFDNYYGGLFGHLDQNTRMVNGALDWHDGDRAGFDEPGYANDLLAARAAREIAERPTDKPLFLYVAFNAVHSPIQPPTRFAGWFSEVPDVKRRQYLRYNLALDEAVGTVLDAIDAAGIANNTIVLYTSDNGADAALGGSNGPWRGGKTTAYEGGTRVPAAVRWTGRIAPFTVVSEPTLLVDWFTTLAKLGGATLIENALDGKDVLPTVSAGARSPHDDFLVTTNTDGSGAVVQREEIEGAVTFWKLVVTSQNANQLFNLSVDPAEASNLASTNVSKRQEMRTIFTKYRTGMVPKITGPNVPGYVFPQGVL